MRIYKDVEHKFNLTGLKEGDSFLGCEHCWFQYAPHVVGYPRCPQCHREPMFEFFVTREDLE